MTNEEYKLKQIEDKLDFIIYLLGNVDLGEINKEDAENFNRLYERSQKRLAQTKLKQIATDELFELNNKVNNILQDYPELQETVNFYSNDKRRDKESN